MGAVDAFSTLAARIVIEFHGVRLTHYTSTSFATRLSSRLRKNYLGTRNFDGPHVWLNRKTLSQDSVRDTRDWQDGRD